MPTKESSPAERERLLRKGNAFILSNIDGQSATDLQDALTIGLASLLERIENIELELMTLRGSI